MCMISVATASLEEGCQLDVGGPPSESLTGMLDREICGCEGSIRFYDMF